MHNSLMEIVMSKLTGKTIERGRLNPVLQNWLDDEAKFGRKIEEWRAVPKQDKFDVPVEVLDLQHLSMDELFTEGDSASLLDEFKSTPDQHFLLDGPKGNLYLIDTKGSDYARYILELV